MKAAAFVVLLIVTVGAVVGAAQIAERYFAPGFERGIVIAVLAGLVVFPLSRWFESRGWVKGSWSVTKEAAALKAAEEARAAAAARAAEPESAAGPARHADASGHASPAAPKDPRA